MTTEKYATDQASLEKDTDVTFFIGSGPGGQNRNKVETGVRLYHRASRVTIKAGRRSSQARNREIAFERLKIRLEKLNNPPAPRILTKVPKSEKRKRLGEKRVRSARKQERQPPPLEQ